MKHLPGLAYSGCSLASGGVAAQLRRAAQHDQERWARRAAAFRAMQVTLRSMPGLSLPDRHDLERMVALRELTPEQAVAWATSIVTSAPWSGR
ncbi:hypothetical protein [Deinococcus sonorensis]|uniref:Uncharacterized protein n=1 Tax=Deinococcus sonorensis TaxID=309891 RepID=A0ABV8YCD2_9DEIO